MLNSRGARVSFGLWILKVNGPTLNLRADPATCELVSFFCNRGWGLITHFFKFGSSTRSAVKMDHFLSSIFNQVRDLRLSPSVHLTWHLATCQMYVCLPVWVCSLKWATGHSDFTSINEGLIGKGIACCWPLVCDEERHFAAHSETEGCLGY